MTCDMTFVFFFFFSSRRRHTRLQGDWSSDVCSSDLRILSQALPGTAVKTGRVFARLHQIARTSMSLLGLAVAGVAARRVSVDVEALVRWCRAEGRPVDSAARAALVADQLRRAGPGVETWT